MAEQEEKVFNLNQQVLAYHGPLLYEAKVMKVHEKNKTFVEGKEGEHEPVESSRLPEEFYALNTYFVHYKGWNAKWDEWVPPSRILEFNEVNLKIQAELKEMTKPAKSKPKKESQSPEDKPEAPQAGPGRKRTVTPSNSLPAKKKKHEGKQYEIEIAIKPQLKYILVDDWEYITKNGQIVELPTERPVGEIIKDYRKHMVSKKATKETMGVVDEVLSGLELYFNSSLGLVLLYKIERLQYLNLIKEYGNNFVPSQVYGLEHLLRLFVSFPGLISQTTMDSTSVGVLVSLLEDILDFITDNLSAYLNNYVNVSPGYSSLARS